MLNEFHARICQAHIKSGIIFSEQVKNPNLCSNCKYVDYARSYFKRSFSNEDSFNEEDMDLNIGTVLLGILDKYC